mgnify:CR=1 FL=1
MLKIRQISKKIVIIILTAASILTASEITVNDVQEVINGQNLKIEGYISNLQAAPFNTDLMSFEVTNDKDPSVKLYLLNVKTKNIFQVESSSYTAETKGKKKYYPKDRGVQWHPYKNWFVFYGNGLSNRDQLFICRVVVPELINNFAVNGYRIRLNENSKEEKSYCIDPCFDMTGDNIYFSRRVQLRDKKAKYNKSYNITLIKDIFQYRDFKFKDVEFKTVLDKRFDQVKPLCSPSDKNLVAYISKKNQPKKGEDYYAEYSINVYNSATSEVVTVDNMDGYYEYPFRWSSTGNQIFYFKALSLLRTPQKFIDDKVNQVNLHFAKITSSATKTDVFIQTNPKTDILLEDVVAKDNSISFINENNIMLSKWDPYETIYLVDINLWKNSDKKYAQKIQFNQDFDTQYPILNGTDLYYVSVVFVKNSPVPSVNVSSVSIKLSGGEKQDKLAVKAEIDSGASDDSIVEEEYSEDEEVYEESSDSDEEIVETKVTPKEKPADTKKPEETKKASNTQKIADLENQKTKLNLDITKLDKQISDETAKKENLEITLKDMEKKSTDLLDVKNSYLEKINQIKSEQTASLESGQKISGIKMQLTKLESDKLSLQNEILKLENTALTEKNVLAQLESKKISGEIEKAEITGIISDLKIQQAKSSQDKDKLALFQTQLNELKQKKTAVDADITKLSQSLQTDRNNLSTYETQLLGYTETKKEIAGTIDKLKSDKLLTLQKDKQSQIRSKESGIAENKQRLVNFEGQIASLSSANETENKTIAELRNKIAKLNDEKLAYLKSISELKSKKAEAKETVVAKKEEPKKEETVKKTEKADDDYSEEEDDYGEDSSVDEDIFEDVEAAPTINRRGRR